MVAPVHVGRWACDSPHAGGSVGLSQGLRKGSGRCAVAAMDAGWLPYDSDYKGGPVGLSQVCDSPHGRGLMTAPTKVGRWACHRAYEGER